MRIIISGGGTGGHLFPALAIANALKKIAPNAEILFVGAQGRIEMEKVPQAGYPIEGLWISGLQRKLSVQNLLFPLKLASSLSKAYRIIQQFKPDIAVGTGGYASGALLQVAAWLKIPILIQEQNSYPGITNKLLAKHAQTICLAYEDAKPYFPSHKIVMTGNPVRDNVKQFAQVNRPEALQYFNLQADKPVLLVVGGSLGARGINEGIMNNLEKYEQGGYQILWQCGKLYYEEIQQRAANYSNTAKIYPFIDRMDLAYAAANGIISRAGAGTIAELCLVGKPTLLMPSPNVAEDHQTANAQALVKQHAALMVRDTDAKDTLYDTSTQLFDPTQSQLLSQQIKKLGIDDAATRIAQLILKLI
jgi:UDP-N-acetylglucosamine--N-acetylmuramyl-(pentapeptide) pyrophosphoryl-undecaprenol N-acetylglucosamine transferase